LIPRRNEAARRLRIAAAALLFVAGWLSVVAHDGLVQHVVCPLHGELLDVSVNTSGVTHPLGVGPGLWAIDGVNGTHDADHNGCTIAQAGAERAATSATSVATVHCSPSAAPAIPAEAQARPSAIPLYRLAPKQSPPASGV